MAAVMVVVAGQCLLAVDGVIGVIHSQCDSGRRLGVVRDERIDQDAGQTVNSPPLAEIGIETG